MKLYRVHVYWICDDPELGRGERNLDTIFEAKDDLIALDFGKAWADNRSKNLEDIFYIKHLACVKIARWFPGGFLKDGSIESSANMPPFFEWKYDWYVGLLIKDSIRLAIEGAKEKIQRRAEALEPIALEANPWMRWFRRQVQKAKASLS